MSDRTSAAVAASTPPTLSTLPLYRAATPDQQAALDQDCAECLAQGLPLADYLAGLAEWASADAYLSSLPADDASDDATTDPAPAADQDDSSASEEQAPAPSSTLAEANRTLTRFGAECRRQADANYTLGALAFQYVQQFLGASPGKAQRPTAVGCLAEEWRRWDEESMSQTVQAATKRLKDRVNTLLAVHAVATLLGDGSGVEKGDGTAKGRGKGAKGGRIAWGTLRELRPLVERDDDDYSETWRVTPGLADAGRALVVEIATSGLARADVVTAVAKLMHGAAVEQLKAVTDSGDDSAVKAARQECQRWAEKAGLKTDDDADDDQDDASEATDDQGSEDKPKASREPSQDYSDDADDDQDASDDPKAPRAPAPVGEPIIDPTAWAAKNPDDVAGMLLQFIIRHKAPSSVLAALIEQLAALPGGKPFHPNGLGDRIISAAFSALETADPADRAA